MSRLIYKIRRKTDGLFSTGGWHPVFAEKGKVWNTRGAVSGHFANFDDARKNKLYRDCEVVLYQVIEDEAETIAVADWRLADSTVRAKELEEKREIQQDKERKQREINELESRLRSLKSKKVSK